MGRFYAILSAVIIGLAFFSCTTEKCPTCPDKKVAPEPEPIDSIADYTFYLAGSTSQGQYIYYYNTTTRELFDSIQIGNWPFNDMAVTNDDRFLILSGGSELGYTYVIDTETKALLHEFHFGGPIEVSRSGSYIAIQRYDVHILDAHTFEDKIIDTAVYRSIKFDWDRDVLYRMNSSNQILPYDLLGDSSLPEIDWTYNEQPDFYLRMILPLPYPMGILVAGLTQSYYEFLANYFPVPDTTIYLYPGRFRHLALTPDGTTLLATDPSSPFWDGTFHPRGLLTLFDVYSSTVSEIVKRPSEVEINAGFEPGEIVMGRDGRMAWIADDWRGWFVPFDLRSNIYMTDNPVIYRDDTLWIKQIACAHPTEGE